MYSRKYDVIVRADSVDAKWERSYRSIPVRVFGSIAMIALATALMYFIVFLPLHPHDGNTAWYVLRHERVSSGYFIEAAIMTLLFWVLCGFILAAGVRSLFPSGEKLHGDCSQLIVSKIPWVNFRGRWTIRVFSLAEVSQMEYGILRRGTAKVPSVYGIRFYANGKVQKILSWIEAPEASHLLRGLKRLGYDVRHDPDMLARIQMTLGDRRSRL
jgi:hypothetical protein